MGVVRPWSHLLLSFVSKCEEDMMNLDHVQQEQLSKVLMEAFPTYESLERMVFYKLGANLEAIADSKNLENCVFLKDF